MTLLKYLLMGLGSLFSDNMRTNDPNPFSMLTSLFSNDIKTKDPDPVTPLIPTFPKDIRTNDLRPFSTLTNFFSDDIRTNDPRPFSTLTNFFSNDIKANDPDPFTTLTSREKYLVQNSWAPMKQDLTANGVRQFLILFERYPVEHLTFDFKDVPFHALSTHKRFQSHCSLVWHAMDALIDSLSDGEILLETLHKLGKNHRQKLVKGSSFWHIKETMLDDFSRYMSAETLEAWDRMLQFSWGILTSELD